MTTKKLKEGDLLTVPQAAEEKGVTRTAILYAIQDGRIAALRVGRNWVIAREALAAYQPRAYRRRATTTRRVPLSA